MKEKINHLILAISAYFQEKPAYTLAVTLLSGFVLGVLFTLETRSLSQQLCLGGGVEVEEPFVAGECDLNGKCEDQNAAGKVDSTTTSVLYIDVSGAVNTPGVYKFENKTLVAEVLKTAGGLLGDASALWVSRKLDHSAELTEHQKIYIPFDWEVELLALNSDEFEISPNDINLTVEKGKDSIQPSISTPSEDKDAYSEKQTSEGVYTPPIYDNISDSGKNVDENAKVNVNSASLGELDALPGIGPAYAQKIIDNRPYKDFDVFKSNSKIPTATSDKLKNLLEF